MALLKPGGAGGGGGGLTLGPPTNSFNGATRAAAETARDTYATANPAWLAQYDAEATYTIILTWPVTPTNTVYQARRSSAWADVTRAGIRGPQGAPPGPTGCRTGTDGTSGDGRARTGADGRGRYFWDGRGAQVGEHFNYWAPLVLGPSLPPKMIFG